MAGREGKGNRSTVQPTTFTFLSFSSAGSKDLRDSRVLPGRKTYQRRSKFNSRAAPCPSCHASHVHR